MNFEEILDAVFYKNDKKTGERKVSCCKLLIAVVIIFLFLGMIGSIVNPDTDSNHNSSSSNDADVKSGDNNSSNGTDTLEILGIEPFTKDTVVSVYDEDFKIPEGYGENKKQRLVETSADDGLVSHHGMYIYHNGTSQISVGYISFEGVGMDDGMLPDEGYWETVGGHEGKLNKDNDGGYDFSYIKNGNQYTVYADSVDDIEKVLM